MDNRGIINTITEKDGETTEQEIQMIRNILKEQATKLGGQLYERCDEMNTFKAQVAKIIEKTETTKEKHE